MKSIGMEVEMMDINQIHPYPQNPRLNDEAVSKTANSIRDFGFKQPIVVDKNMVVIVGHTRLKASQQLGLKKVPVVVAKDLTEQEAKAYRLADNRTGELAEWDVGLLDGELADITELDMNDYGFADSLEDAEDIDIVDQDEEDDTEFTPNFLNAQKQIFEGVGEYDIPQIKGIDHIEEVDWISFNMLNSYKSEQPFGVHHFIDDYQFEREWSQIEVQLPRLQRAKYVTSPDFSIYTDFPKAMQIWNHYRKHWIGAYLEAHGLAVIPTIAWGDESSFDWCFDGEPVGKPVAVSSVGVMNNPETKDMFLEGYVAMVERLRPSQILFYGEMIPELESDETIIPVKSFTNKWRED